MALLINTDGSLKLIGDIHQLWYDGVRDLVGGPTEELNLDGGRVLIVNEEFKLRNLPQNVGATSLIQQRQEPVREGMSPMLAKAAVGSPTVLGPAILVEASEWKKVAGGSNS